MNLLIVGGLLALAVVAIVGAVLLGIGEERAEKEKQQKEKDAALSAQATLAPQESDETLPPTMLPPTMSETLTSGDLRTTRQLAPSLHEDEHLSAQISDQLPASNEEDDITLLNGQIYTITGELRSMAQKASELEQRLNALSEILESQQHHQNGVTAKTSAFRKIEISSF